MSKRLVLCCDGTWNTADQVNDKGELCSTNVVKIPVRLAKRAADGTRQIIYYDHGVGTGNKLDRLAGGAFGEGLEANIHDAYRFLIANYEEDDEIYLFGYSRGAYTARSVAGMVRKCGILRREKVRLYREAKTLYRNAAVKPDDAAAVEFRRANAIRTDTPIAFIGVWDTVGALGIPIIGQDEHKFLDTKLSPFVRHAYHALAIDERRGPFEPTLWDSDPAPGQTVEQVWFAGAHSDIGGGYAETGLSDIALLWMMNRAERAGLRFDQPVVDALGTKPDPTMDAHDSLKGLYKLRREDRRLGRYKTEYLHRTVLERWRANPNHRTGPLKPLASRIEQLLAGPLDRDVYPVS